MKLEDIGAGVRVRLTADGRARRLWAAQSDNAATVRYDPPFVGHGDARLVRVTVDGERRARVRTMRPELLEVL